MPQLPYKITTVAELKERIASLELVKEEQEEKLKHNLLEVYESLQPAELMKSAISHLRNDDALHHDLTALAGNAGIDFAARKIFGKDNSIGGTIKTLVASQALRFVYSKYHDKIHELIGNAAGKVIDFFESPPKSANAENEKKD